MMRRRVATVVAVVARSQVAAVKAGAKAVTAAALSVSAPTVFVTRARADWRE